MWRSEKGVSFAETLAYSARVSKNTKDWNGKILDDKEIQIMRESCIVSDHSHPGLSCGVGLGRAVHRRAVRFRSVEGKPADSALFD